jgi:hypothetical protein
MYKQHPGFRLVAVGVLLTFVELRVDSFDYVPDWLGYAFTAFGLGRLTIRNARFNLAYPLACALCLLALVVVFVPETFPVIPSNPGDSPFRTALDIFWARWSLSTIVVAVFGLALNWLICDGVKQFSFARGDVSAAGTAMRRRDQYAGLSLLWLFSLVLAIGLPRIGFVVVFGVGLCSIVLDIAVVRLLWRVADASPSEQMLAQLIDPVVSPPQGVLDRIRHAWRAGQHILFVAFVNMWVNR